MVVTRTHLIGTPGKVLNRVVRYQPFEDMASQRDAKGQAVSLCQSKQEVFDLRWGLEKGSLWAWSSLLFFMVENLGSFFFS